MRLSEIEDEPADTVAGQAAGAAAPRPAPARDAIVTVTGLGKVFKTSPLIGRTRTTVALDDVGFTIARGESLGLIGETGSGKTTIARTLLGLVTPDAGRIELDGIDSSNYRKLSRADRKCVRRFVQVVFQDPYASLNPALRIGSALQEAIDQRGTKPPTRRPKSPSCAAKSASPPSTRSGCRPRCRAGSGNGSRSPVPSRCGPKS
nr:ATP-binding cassette domain-containing protein [Amycolatopsis sulphurea]